MTEIDTLKNPCLQFIAEDDFSYFCKFDDLAGPIVQTGPEFSSIANSCYISRKEAFGELLKNIFK